MFDILWWMEWKSEAKKVYCPESAYWLLTRVDSSRQNQGKNQGKGCVVHLNFRGLLNLKSKCERQYKIKVADKITYRSFQQYPPKSQLFQTVPSALIAERAHRRGFWCRSHDRLWVVTRERVGPLQCWNPHPAPADPGGGTHPQVSVGTAGARRGETGRKHHFTNCTLKWAVRIDSQSSKERQVGNQIKFLVTVRDFGRCT